MSELIPAIILGVGMTQSPKPVIKTSADWFGEIHNWEIETCPESISTIGGNSRPGFY